MIRRKILTMENIELETGFGGTPLIELIDYNNKPLLSQNLVGDEIIDTKRNRHGTIEKQSNSMLWVHWDGNKNYSAILLSHADEIKKYNLLENLNEKVNNDEIDLEITTMPAPKFIPSDFKTVSGKIHKGILVEGNDLKDSLYAFIFKNSFSRLNSFEEGMKLIEPNSNIYITNANATNSFYVLWINLYGHEGYVSTHTYRDTLSELLGEANSDIELLDKALDKLEESKKNKHKSRNLKEVYYEIEDTAITFTDNLNRLKNMFNKHYGGYRCCYDISQEGGDVVGFCDIEEDIHDNIEDELKNYAEHTPNFCRFIVFHKAEYGDSLDDEIDYYDTELKEYEYENFILVWLEEDEQFEGTKLYDVLGTPIKTFSWKKVREEATANIKEDLELDTIDLPKIEIEKFKPNEGCGGSYKGLKISNKKMIKNIIQIIKDDLRDNSFSTWSINDFISKMDVKSPVYIVASKRDLSDNLCYVYTKIKDSNNYKARCLYAEDIEKAIDPIDLNCLEDIDVVNEEIDLDAATLKTEAEGLAGWEQETAKWEKRLQDCGYTDIKLTKIYPHRNKSVWYEGLRIVSFNYRGFEFKGYSSGDGVYLQLDDGTIICDMDDMIEYDVVDDDTFKDFVDAQYKAVNDELFDENDIYQHWRVSDNYHNCAYSWDADYDDCYTVRDLLEQLTDKEKIDETLDYFIKEGFLKESISDEEQIEEDLELDTSFSTKFPIDTFKTNSGEMLEGILITNTEVQQKLKDWERRHAEWYNFKIEDDSEVYLSPSPFGYSYKLWTRDTNNRGYTYSLIYRGDLEALLSPTIDINELSSIMEKYLKESYIKEEIDLDILELPENIKLVDFLSFRGHRFRGIIIEDDEIKRKLVENLYGDDASAISLDYPFYITKDFFDNSTETLILWSTTVGESVPTGSYFKLNEASEILKVEEDFLSDILLGETGIIKDNNLVESKKDFDFNNFKKESLDIETSEEQFIIKDRCIEIVNKDLEKQLIEYIIKTMLVNKNIFSESDGPLRLWPYKNYEGRDGILITYSKDNYKRMIFTASIAEKICKIIGIDFSDFNNLFESYTPLKESLDLDTVNCDVEFGEFYPAHSSVPRTGIKITDSKIIKKLWGINKQINRKEHRKDHKHIINKNIAYITAGDSTSNGKVWFKLEDTEKESSLKPGYYFIEFPLQSLEEVLPKGTLNWLEDVVEESLNEELDLDSTDLNDLTHIGGKERTEELKKQLEDCGYENVQMRTEIYANRDDAVWYTGYTIVSFDYRGCFIVGKSDGEICIDEGVKDVVYDMDDMIEYGVYDDESFYDFVHKLRDEEKYLDRNTAVLYWAIIKGDKCYDNWELGYDSCYSITELFDQLTNKTDLDDVIDTEFESVVNENLTTVKAYHGSDVDFDSFDNSKMGSGNGGALFGKGFYFTPHKEIAKDYGNIIKPYQLTFKKPFNYYGWTKEDIKNLLDNSGYKYDKELFDSIELNDDIDLIDNVLDVVLIEDDAYEVFSEMLKKSNYDGILAGDEVVVFDSNQIKRIDEDVDLDAIGFKDIVGQDKGRAVIFDSDDMGYYELTAEQCQLLDTLAEGDSYNLPNSVYGEIYRNDDDVWVDFYDNNGGIFLGSIDNITTDDLELLGIKLEDIPNGTAEEQITEEIDLDTIDFKVTNKGRKFGLCRKYIIKQDDPVKTEIIEALKGHLDNYEIEDLQDNIDESLWEIYVYTDGRTYIHFWDRKSYEHETLPFDWKLIEVLVTHFSKGKE